MKSWRLRNLIYATKASEKLSESFRKAFRKASEKLSQKLQKSFEQNFQAIVSFESFEKRQENFEVIFVETQSWKYFGEMILQSRLEVQTWRCKFVNFEIIKKIHQNIQARMKMLRK